MRRETVLIKATRTKALRPGVVHHRIRRHVPCQIRTTLPTGLRVDEILLVKAVGVGRVVWTAARLSTLLVAAEAAADATDKLVTKAEVTRADRRRQLLRDDVVVERRKECRLLRLTTLVLIERSVLRLHAWVSNRRARDRADRGQTGHIVVVRARGQRLVMPARPVIQNVVFIKRSNDTAQTPVVRRAKAQFVLLMLVALVCVPVAGWRIALRRHHRIAHSFRAVALVVVGIHATRVVGVITGLIDLTGQVTAGVDRLDVADLSVHRPSGAREVVLVVGIVEQCHFQRLERRAI